VEDFTPYGWCRALIVLFLAAPLGDFCSDGVFVEDFAPCGWCRALIVLFLAAPLGDFFSDGVFVEDFAPCGWCRALIVIFPAAPLGDFCSDLSHAKAIKVACCGDCLSVECRRPVSQSFSNPQSWCQFELVFLWGAFVAVYYMAPPP
jgi:hypothetical protein